MTADPNEVVPLRLGGAPAEGEGVLEVRDPWSGETVAKVASAGPETIERAAEIAAAAFERVRRLASHERAEILARTSALLHEHRERFARTIQRENGKPIAQARVEVDRACHTFRLAAEEATRITGEWLPLDLRPGLEGLWGVWRRVPLGPVLAIAPFNFPLNLVAHKVAPALAAGCPVVVKPSSRTPLSALRLAEALSEAGLPEGALSVLPCDRRSGDALVEDERFAVLSFTGSPDVGFALRARAGKKESVLELGGNAAVVVCQDADIEDAAARTAAGAFAYAGQVCISVQRAFVHRSVADRFVEALVERTRTLKVGDPADEETFVGPMIDRANAERIEKWIEQALSSGARRLVGGAREGNVVPPTVLEGVDPALPIDCREAFGPVVNVHRYDSFDEAVRRVNDSRYGLQAGLFTRDVGRIQRAWDEIEVGGLIVNDAPTFRVDAMPYGGTKDSGRGREGVRYAIEHFTERRLLVLRPPAGGNGGGG